MEFSTVASLVPRPKEEEEKGPGFSRLRMPFLLLSGSGNKATQLHTVAHDVFYVQGA